jgi:SpoVK/Ycf46/Vps4 family AAA+-type ATPase
VEIDYLLQRMEEHDGVAILATNRKQDMDEAFTRRFDIIVSFSMPDAAHRFRIWESMFPANAERDGKPDCSQPARKFELSGEDLRNVVLSAVYLASIST